MPQRGGPAGRFLTETWRRSWRGRLARSVGQEGRGCEEAAAAAAVVVLHTTAAAVMILHTTAAAVVILHTTAAAIVVLHTTAAAVVIPARYTNQHKVSVPLPSPPPTKPIFIHNSIFFLSVLVGSASEIHE